VNASELAARLAEAGMPPSELPAKTQLFETAVSGLQRLAHRDPEAAWWVPGRLEVFGKHVDYAGGHSLVAPLPAGFIVVGARTSGDSIQILDARNDELVVDPDRTTKGIGWQQYARVVASRLGRNFPGSRRGVAIAFASDLPRASGMSSSSALVVSVARALIRLWEIDRRSEWAVHVRTDEDLATLLACIENGSSFRDLRGDRGVGTQGGSEDHTAMILGRQGHLAYCTFVPLRRRDEIAVPADWTFVSAFSGVPASKTGAVRQRYNRLSRGVQTLVDLWNRHEPRAVSLAAALESRPDAAERLLALIDASSVSSSSTAALAQRLEHFRIENALTQSAADAFRQADVQAVTDLAAASQSAADRLLGNQIDATRRLVERARARGAFAASAFGAGFGGSVWALTRAEEAARFTQEWQPGLLGTGPGSVELDIFPDRRTNR
jgi:galactokinase